MRDYARPPVAPPLPATRARFVYNREPPRPAAILPPPALEDLPAMTWKNAALELVRRDTTDYVRAVLDSMPDVCDIHLVMPNRHHLPVDLTPFGLANRNEIFVATDQPFGLIQATIRRN